MRRAFLKTAFAMTVLCLLVLLLCLWTFVSEVLSPMSPGPDGMYRTSWGGGGPLLVGLVAFACLWIADWSTAHLFRLARITDERWSILKSRRRY